MAKRFRKTVRISKGIGVNFSKSGTSLSLGRTGHRVNISGRGVRTSFGIPGTGIKYSKTYGSKRKKRTSSSVSRSTSSRLPSSVTISMNDKGQIILLDAMGSEITNPSVIRSIKNTDAFKQQKEALEIQRQERINEIIQNSAEENAQFINIISLSPVVYDAAEFEQEVNDLAPMEYTEEKPDIESVTDELADETEETIKGLFAGKKKKQYIADNLQQRLAEEIAEWEADKLEAEAAYQKAYEEEKQFMLSLLQGDSNAICQAFDNWISDIELPVEIGIDYDWDEEKQTMFLDVDLPEIEDLPDTVWTKTDAGNLKEKKKTAAEKREEYAKCVLGLAVFISSNTFNISPKIQKILISGYTQRRDKEGSLNDDYIYSIKFRREKFEGIKLSIVIPKNFCMAFENRCNTTSTGLFKVIKPFDAFE